MTGADEFCAVFTEEEIYGDLWIVPSYHARGKTFHIWVGRPHSAESVEVYGITGGQPGWTETYGWLHTGPWSEDFLELYEVRKGIKELENQEAHKGYKERKAAALREKHEILSRYKSPVDSE